MHRLLLHVGGVGRYYCRLDSPVILLTHTTMLLLYRTQVALVPMVMMVPISGLQFNVGEMRKHWRWLLFRCCVPAVVFVAAAFAFFGGYLRHPLLGFAMAITLGELFGGGAPEILRYQAGVGPGDQWWRLGANFVSFCRMKFPADVEERRRSRGRVGGRDFTTTAARHRLPAVVAATPTPKSDDDLVVDDGVDDLATRPSQQRRHFEHDGSSNWETTSSFGSAAWSAACGGAAWTTCGSRGAHGFSGVIGFGVDAGNDSLGVSSGSSGPWMDVAEPFEPLFVEELCPPATALATVLEVDEAPFASEEAAVARRLTLAITRGRVAAAVGDASSVGRVGPEAVTTGRETSRTTLGDLDTTPTSSLHGSAARYEEHAAERQSSAALSASPGALSEAEAQRPASTETVRSTGAAPPTTASEVAETTAPALVTGTAQVSGARLVGNAGARFFGHQVAAVSVGTAVCMLDVFFFAEAAHAYGGIGGELCRVVALVAARKLMAVFWYGSVGPARIDRLRHAHISPLWLGGNLGSITALYLLATRSLTGVAVFVVVDWLVYLWRLFSVAEWGCDNDGSEWGLAAVVTAEGVSTPGGAGGDRRFASIGAGDVVRVVTGPAAGAAREGHDEESAQETNADNVAEDDDDMNHVVGRRVGGEMSAEEQEQRGGPEQRRRRYPPPGAVDAAEAGALASPSNNRGNDMVVSELDLVVVPRRLPPRDVDRDGPRGQQPLAAAAVTSSLRIRLCRKLLRVARWGRMEVPAGMRPREFYGWVVISESVVFSSLLLGCLGFYALVSARVVDVDLSPGRHPGGGGGAGAEPGTGGAGTLDGGHRALGVANDLSATTSRTSVDLAGACDLGGAGAGGSTTATVPSPPASSGASATAAAAVASVDPAQDILMSHLFPAGQLSAANLVLALVSDLVQDVAGHIYISKLLRCDYSRVFVGAWLRDGRHVLLALGAAPVVMSVMLLLVLVAVDARE